MAPGPPDQHSAKEAETQMKAFVVSTYGENGLQLADERSPGLALPSQRPEPEAVG